MSLPDISNHALVRYRERVKPGLGRKDALYDMRRLLVHHAERSDTKPGWLYAGLYDDSDYWLIVGDTAGFPVLDGKITTCLIPSSFPPEVRKARSQARGYRRRRNGAKKMQEKTRSAKRLANRTRQRFSADDEAA